jgi:outer membrane immunogenic protein
MHKLLLATAAAVLLSTPTFAADLAPMPAEPVAPAYLPFTWTGGYVGVQVGYGWGDESDDQSEIFLDALEAADEFDMDGFLGGVHAGFNWQMGALVLGVEGDVEFSTYEGDADFNYVTAPDEGFAGTLSMESDWQASLRLRAGFAIDRLLIYGTGGVAFADAELSSTGREYDDGGFFGPTLSDSDDQTLIGWTAGIGLEYAFTDNFTARVEGRYTDFGEDDFNIDGQEIEAGFDQWAVRVGVSYKF